MRKATDEDEDDDEVEVEALCDALHQAFPDAVPTVDEVRRAARDIRDRYQGAPVRQCVPVLAYRDMREALTRQRHPTCSQCAPGP